MAIKVTGLFQNPKSKQLFQSPKFELVPHLTYKGEIKMDLHIVSDYRGTIGYENIDRDILQYDTKITDPYNQLIDALESYVINDLTQSNPDCIFEKGYIEEVVEETAEEIAEENIDEDNTTEEG
jgi:hypothetical protein